MELTTFSNGRRDECAEFWFDLYKDQPYVHRPDGYQNVNSPAHIGPSYFLKHLDAGLTCRATQHWHGEVRDDTIFLAIDQGKLAGFLVTSVDADASKGSILAAYVPWTGQSREAATQLLDQALRSFKQAGLKEAAAGPDVTKSLEAEGPIHLALLDAGFAWKDVWHDPQDDRNGVEYVRGEPSYGVFLGGSLEGFSVRPEIEAKLKSLAADGIVIEKIPAKAFTDLGGGGYWELERAMKRGVEGEETFVALQNGTVIGWLDELLTWSCWAEEGTSRTMGGCVPVVIPEYRGRGIGKAIYHLGMDAVVKQGAQAGWTATEIWNPARVIYQSVGYRNWYLAVNLLYRDLS